MQMSVRGKKALSYLPLVHAMRMQMMRERERERQWQWQCFYWIQAICLVSKGWQNSMHVQMCITHTLRRRIYMIIFSLSLTHTHTNTHSLSLSLPLSLTHTHTHTHSHACMHTHTHTHRHTYTHMRVPHSVLLLLRHLWAFWLERGIYCPTASATRFLSSDA